MTAMRFESWHLTSRAHLVLEAAEVAALDESHLHHLFDVRRLDVGDLVTLCDGAGTLRRAEVVRVQAQAPSRRGQRRERGLTLLAKGAPETFAVPEFNIEMVLAMIDFSKLEIALSKLTELGVSEITLVEARRSLSVAGGAKRVTPERITRLLRESASQCRSLFLPKVTFQTMESVLARVTVCERGAPAMQVRPRALLIGPEGGFEAGEIPEGVRKVSLPGHVLRAETAAIAAAAIALSLTE